MAISPLALAAYPAYTYTMGMTENSMILPGGLCMSKRHANTGPTISSAATAVRRLATNSTKRNYNCTTISDDTNHEASPVSMRKA